MFFEAAQVILAVTGALLYLFHHRKHLQTLIWRPYVLLLFGLGTVFLLTNTSKLLCLATWLFFVCLHYFKDLQKGNESECPICFEDLKTSFPYECTRCKKATHARCVVEYLERSEKESFLCPFCRKDLRVKKEELKLAIERFEKLMGGEDTKERLENETAEDQPTTASEKRQGKLLSLLTALKTATLVSLMVTFYGSYQLFKDSYRALPGDLKTFAGVLTVDVVQFVHGPMRMIAQKMYGVALIVIKFIKEGTTVKRLTLWILQTVQTVATSILNSSLLPILKKGTMDALHFLVHTFPTLAYNFTRRTYNAAKQVIQGILTSRFMAELKEDLYVLFSFTFRTVPILVKDVAVTVWRSRTAEFVKQKTLDALVLAFQTLPGLCSRTVYVLSVSIRDAIIAMWHSQLLCDVLNALSNVIGALHEFVNVHGVYVYNNVLFPLAKFLYDAYWIICEALYKVVIFMLKTVLPIGISLCKDLYSWLRSNLPELFKTILSSSRLLWSYTSLVLRELWATVLNSRAWVAIVKTAQHLKWVVINAYAVIHNLSITAKKAAVVGFHTVTQLSGAALRKMTELLLTSKIVFATIMHSQVVENLIVPSVMYAGTKSRELAQSTVQYFQVYGPRVREAMVDAMWVAYNYDYNGVLYMLMESLRGTMRRVLYRDANAGKT